MSVVISDQAVICPQECGGDQESVSASSRGQAVSGYEASSAASSVDGEEGASTSDPAVRPPRRRGGRRCDAFGHVYSGPNTSYTVQSEPLHCPVACSWGAGKLIAVLTSCSHACVSICAACGYCAFL